MVESIDFKRNCLNLFRLLAAIEVLYWHTIKHLELDKLPVFTDIIKYFTGVPLFFTLSGFLIWQSIGRSHTFGGYAKKRFWRIYPELWVAVAVEIVVLLCLYHQPIDWPKMGLFTLGQSTIFQFWTPGFLRGYGCGAPNGALWAISVLIQFYFLAYFFYKWLHGKNLIIWGGWILGSLIVGWMNPFISNALPLYLGKLYTITLIPFLWMFIMAAFVAEYKDVILPFLKKYWWAFVVLLIFKREFVRWDIDMSLYQLIYTVLLFCGVVGVAYAFPKINIKTDISYGVYIYHMTVVNALIALGFTGQSWTIYVVIAVTGLLAWISTKTIGHLSVREKSKIA